MLINLRVFRFFLFLAVLIFAGSGKTQNVSGDKFKMVYEHMQEDVSVNLEGNEVNLSHKVYERKSFNEQVSSDYSSDRVYQGYFVKVKNINASVSYLNKNDKRKRIRITDIPIKTDFSGNTFYDDNSYYDVTYSNINKGSITELNYELEVLDPHFMRRFYFSDYYPVKSAVYSILADPGVDIGWKLYGDQKEEVEFSKIEIDGKIKYTWILKNASALESERNEPGFLHKATHIVVFIKQYIGESGEVNLLNNVGDLFKWYQTFISDIKPADNEDLVKLTNEVIKGKTSDIEKTKTIFHWVQDNIRYIAFEDGWRGFIPYPASEICEKRYGDCKDMSHLMYEMLHIAGVEANHAWVGTRKLPYLYEDTPCPSVDNHLILSVVLNDSVYILDATDGHTPFGVPTSFILSKEMLFKFNDDYRIYTIPAYTADYCTVKEDIDIYVDDINVLGKGTKTIETFEYSKFHNLYGSANTEKDKFLKDYLELGQNNFEVLELKIEDIEPRAKTAIKYEYSIPNYLNAFDDLLFVNMNLTKPLSEGFIQKDRIYDYVIKYKKRIKSKITLDIPKGKQLVDIPENVMFKCKYGSVMAEYLLEGNSLVYKRTITIDKLKVVKEDFEIWNTFIKQLIAVYNTTIELK